MSDRHVPFSTHDPEIEARIETLLEQMTLDEKVGQMNQLVPRRSVDLVEEIRAGRLGFLLSITDVLRSTAGSALRWRRAGWAP